MAAEAAADNAMIANATVAEALVTANTEARTALTLVQATAAAAAASCGDSVMVAQAATDNPMNDDATTVEEQVTATAEART